jgi:hypothetical protein
MELKIGSRLADGIFESQHKHYARVSDMCMSTLSVVSVSAVVSNCTRL